MPGKTPQFTKTIIAPRLLDTAGAGGYETRPETGS